MYIIFNFFFQFKLVGQVRQICKPLFFRHGLPCLKPYLIFLTRHIDLVKDPVCCYKSCPSRYLKNNDLRNAASFFHFQCFLLFSVVNVVVFDKTVSVCIASSCIPVFKILLIVILYTCLLDTKSARNA